MKISIRKTDGDSNDLVLQDKFVGYGYIPKDGSPMGLIRCPKCGKENYAMSVSSGQCSWCGFQANDLDVSNQKI